MEALLSHGEGLGVPERMIIAPSVGVFRPLDDVDAGALVDEGQPVGHLDGPGTSTPVCSPFRGRLIGMMVSAGERLREGQPVAWLRVAERMRAAITGWGTALPEQRLTNAELAQRVDTSDQWIVERTGIRERRVAQDGETTASLAIEAGAAAIKHAGLTPDAIDLLIVATATIEQLVPHTGAFVNDGLGISCGSFDLNAGCAGFVYGLVVGSSMLTAGNLDHVLLIGAETLSRIIDPLDRTTCILFGDGAAAMVLSASADDDGPGLLSFDLGVDGSATALLGVPAGGSRRPPTPENIAAGDHYLKMAGPEVFRRAVWIVVDSATNALRRADVSVDDIAWFAPHQANLRIIDAAANRLAIPPERTLVNIDRYGNTSAASIPLVLAEAADDGRLRPGDLVLLSGFGAGLTWGSAVLRWGTA